MCIRDRSGVTGMSAAEPGKSSGPFVRGVTIEKSLAWGTEAWWLGQRSTEQMTHRWTCYVRSAAPGDEEGPPGPEDQLGTFVKKVVFRLHSSFTNPTRVVQKPPFQVTATGWGEFEIAIRVYFMDPTEDCIDLFQTLKLFPKSEDELLTPKKPVLSEQRDEIVFNDPTLTFYRCLLKGAMTVSHREKFNTTEEEEMRAIKKAHIDVKEQIQILEEKLK
eukprot:TRINITY_DN20206_c0_g1_i1.p1 TRINITY_DN20206_c0_g1~~TRINITY_DN20206_c0_g1_i1.p1  ORF type:complete len:218 (-),score=46.53 TRINITY_DN20206_c0_g1_i1:122-775(-)